MASRTRGLRTAALWIAEHAADRLGTTKLAISGFSAGATLAITTLLRLRDRGISLVDTAVLQFGTYDLSAQTPAGRLIADEYFLDAYAGSASDRTHPDLSPIYADLAALPPVLMVIGDADILLQDNLAMAMRLSAAGVEVDLRVYPDFLTGSRATQPRWHGRRWTTSRHGCTAIWVRSRDRTPLVRAVRSVRRWSWQSQSSQTPDAVSRQVIRCFSSGGDKVMVPPEHPADRRPDGADGTPEHGQPFIAPTPVHAHLAELHALLAADRERTSDRISALTRDLTSIVEATRLTATDDEHDPEGSTTAFERSQTAALLAAANDHLADVDMALERIADGNYGRCEHCSEPISHERLFARPAARTCIACAA